MILTDESLAWLDHILQQSPDTRLSADDGRKLLADLREARGLINEFLMLDNFDALAAEEEIRALTGPEMVQFAVALMRPILRMSTAMGLVKIDDFSPETREKYDLDALGVPS